MPQLIRQGARVGTKEWEKARVIASLPSSLEPTPKRQSANLAGRRSPWPLLSLPGGRSGRIRTDPPAKTAWKTRAKRIRRQEGDPPPRGFLPLPPAATPYGATYYSLQNAIGKLPVGMWVPLKLPFYFCLMGTLLVGVFPLRWAFICFMGS